MAKKTATRIDDTQRTLTIKSPSDTVSAVICHVPDMLMRANRRQYTQCRAYDVRIKGATLPTTQETIFEVYTLSNAWWVKKSIEMAKGVYNDLTKKERMLLGENAARYGDFIISASTGAAGNYANLYQFEPASSGDDMTISEVSSDETLFETTLVADMEKDNFDTMGFTVLSEDLSGPGVFNIFNEYLLSQSITPDADNRDGPYADLFRIDRDVMASLQQDGDLTPWDADAFPSPWVLADVISVDQTIPTGGPAWSKTITAPLGMVVVKKRTNAGAEVNFALNDMLLLEARKGTYKGVHAPAYRAMKGLHQGLA